jgi:hypothetical protein
MYQNGPSASNLIIPKSTHDTLTTVIHEMLLNDDDKYLIKNPFMLRVNHQIRKMTVSTREIADRALLRRGQYMDKKTPEEYAQWVCSEPGHAREFMALIRLERVEDEPMAVTIARNCIRTNTSVNYDQMVHDPCLSRVFQRHTANDEWPLVLKRLIQTGQRELLDFVLRDHSVKLSLENMITGAAPSCLPLLLEHRATPVTAHTLEKLIEVITPDVTLYNPLVMLQNVGSMYERLPEVEFDLIVDIGRLYAGQSIDLKNVENSLHLDVRRAFVTGLLSAWCVDDEWMSRCFAVTLGNIGSLNVEVRLISEMCDEPLLQHCLLEYSLTHGSLNDMNKMLSIPGFLDNSKINMFVDCMDVDRCWALMRHGVSVSGWKDTLKYIASMPGGASISRDLVVVLSTALYDPQGDHEGRASRDVMNTVKRILMSNARWIDPVEFMNEMRNSPNNLFSVH